MQYLAALYAQEDERSDPSSEAFAQDLERYAAFDEVAGERIVGGEALEPAAQAVSIRRVGGEVLVTDGPFTETSEVLGGFFVLEADDLDAAIELARHIPAADHGAVELRPMVQWFQRDAELQDGERRYLAVLAGEENAASQPDSPQWQEAVALHDRFAAESAEAILGGAALHPAESATTVRVRDGALLVTEGPFQETSEVVGGLYLLLGSSVDEVTKVASRIPMGESGVIELRPVMEFDT